MCIRDRCKSVHSFGSLSYFKGENAPEGAPEYCIDGCPHSKECRFDAVKLYLKNRGAASKWFREACTRIYDPTDEDVEKAIRTTQYGKCVYKCNNNVVDHQTVNILFEDDITVTFSMNAFNMGGRHIHIFGTQGDVYKRQTLACAEGLTAHANSVAVRRDEDATE